MAEIHNKQSFLNPVFNCGRLRLFLASATYMMLFIKKSLEKKEKCLCQLRLQVLLVNSVGL
jgi:hypothetical protein